MYTFNGRLPKMADKDAANGKGGQVKIAQRVWGWTRDPVRIWPLQTLSDALPCHAQEVTPWEVKGNEEGKIDYAKLVREVKAA